MTSLQSNIQGLLLLSLVAGALSITDRISTVEMRDQVQVLDAVFEIGQIKTNPEMVADVQSMIGYQNTYWRERLPKALSVANQRLGGSVVVRNAMASPALVWERSSFDKVTEAMGEPLIVLSIAEPLPVPESLAARAVQAAQKVQSRAGDETPIKFDLTTQFSRGAQKFGYWFIESAPAGSGEGRSASVPVESLQIDSTQTLAQLGFLDELAKIARSRLWYLSDDRQFQKPLRASLQGAGTILLYGHSGGSDYELWRVATLRMGKIIKRLPTELLYEDIAVVRKHYHENLVSNRLVN